MFTEMISKVALDVLANDYNDRLFKEMVKMWDLYNHIPSAYTLDEWVEENLVEILVDTLTYIDAELPREVAYYAIEKGLTDEATLNHWVEVVINLI